MPLAEWLTFGEDVRKAWLAQCQDNLEELRSQFREKWENTAECEDKDARDKGLPVRKHREQCAKYGSYLRLDRSPWSDYWEQVGDMWIRWHVQGRRAVFAPQAPGMGAHGPDPAKLLSDRITYAGNMVVPIRDSWRCFKSRHSKVGSSVWCGKTVFFEDLAKKSPSVPALKNHRNDFWEQQGCTWTRVHVVPRKAGFTPVGVAGGLTQILCWQSASRILTDKNPSRTSGRVRIVTGRWRRALYGPAGQRSRCNRRLLPVFLRQWLAPSGLIGPFGSRPELCWSSVRILIRSSASFLLVRTVVWFESRGRTTCCQTPAWRRLWTQLKARDAMLWWRCPVPAARPGRLLTKPTLTGARASETSNNCS